MPSAMGIALAEEIELGVQIGVKAVLSFACGYGYGINSPASQERRPATGFGNQTGLAKSAEPAINRPRIFYAAESYGIPCMVLIFSSGALDNDAQILDAGSIDRAVHFRLIDIGSTEGSVEGIEDGCIECNRIARDLRYIPVIGYRILIDIPSFVGFVGC